MTGVAARASLKDLTGRHFKPQSQLSRVAGPPRRPHRMARCPKRRPSSIAMARSMPRTRTLRSAGQVPSSPIPSPENMGCPSMAYVPQVFFAATLAAQRCVILGDFR